jgi:hypothetical protein
MANGDIVPGNPASLAAAAVEAEMAWNLNDSFQITPEDEQVLVHLDQTADSLNFLDQPYFVETSRALSIPVGFEEGEEKRYGNFYGLTFEGVLKSYSKVMIGRVIGAKSVRAWCLAFDKVTLLPFFDELPEDRLLHVPALAVNEIQQTG